MKSLLNIYKVAHSPSLSAGERAVSESGPHVKGREIRKEEFGDFMVWI